MLTDQPTGSEFSSLLNHYVKQQPQIGDIVTGTVLRINKRTAWIDLQGKLNGLVTDARELQINQMATFTIVAESPNDDFLLLSATSKSAWSAKVAWSQARLALHSYIQVTVLATKAYRDKPEQISGLVAATPWGIEGFIPWRHLRQCGKPLARLVDQKIWVKVIEVNCRNHDLILSQAAVLKERKRYLLAHPQQIKQGTVVDILSFGAVLDIGYGVTALLHRSNMSKELRNNLAAGQQLEIEASVIQSGELALKLR